MGHVSFAARVARSPGEIADAVQFREVRAVRPYCCRIRIVRRVDRQPNIFVRHTFRARVSRHARLDLRSTNSREIDIETGVFLVRFECVNRRHIQAMGWSDDRALLDGSWPRARP